MSQEFKYKDTGIDLDTINILCIILVFVFSSIWFLLDGLSITSHPPLDF